MATSRTTATDVAQAIERTSELLGQELFTMSHSDGKRRQYRVVLDSDGRPLSEYGTTTETVAFLRGMREAHRLLTEDEA